MEKESEHLVFTGERFVPEVHGNIELEHLHRYMVADTLGKGKRVLDIASGEGYGSAMLAENAESVIGIDISQEAVKHAQQRYQKKNLQFMVGSCSQIPLSDASVDLVVSFETIEHHDQHEKMMEEIRRVLRPDGLLLISSPDKYNYSEVPNYKNPFHVKELYRHEFENLLSKYFQYYSISGQRVLYGSAIFDDKCRLPNTSYWQEGNSINKAAGIVNPLYLIALASNTEIPSLNSGIFEQPITESDYINSWRRIVSERDGQIASLNQAIAESDEQIADLTRVVTERDGQIADLTRAVTERDGQIADQAKKLNEIYHSRGWKILTLYYKISQRVLPADSIRLMFIKKSYHFLNKSLSAIKRSFVPKKQP